MDSVNRHISFPGGKKERKMDTEGKPQQQKQQQAKIE